MTQNKTAVIFGATGLVGQCLVDQLKSDAFYSSIEVLNRHAVNYNHFKVNEHVIDFDRLGDFASLIRGDHLFICLGTTIRKAGSIKRMEEIDRDLPVGIARIAHENGVKGIAVVSSVGANPSSRNYYLRIKGELEEGIRKIPFDRTVIARPSMLLGHREVVRLGELVGRVLMKAAGFMLIGPARKYRGISGSTVAAAIISLIRIPQGEKIYQSDELQKSGRR